MNTYVFNVENEEKDCYYCGGNCPNEPEDSKYLCDGFAGDIDGLYAEEEEQRKYPKSGVQLSPRSAKKYFHNSESTIQMQVTGPGFA